MFTQLRHHTVPFFKQVVHNPYFELVFTSQHQVAHLEYQFEIRDHRLVPKDPVQRFGFCSNSSKLGRYAKGTIIRFLPAFHFFNYAQATLVQTCLLMGTEMVVFEFGTCAVLITRWPTCVSALSILSASVAHPVYLKVSCLAGKTAHVMFHQSCLIASSEDNNIACFSYSEST